MTLSDTCRKLMEVKISPMERILPVVGMLFVVVVGPIILSLSIRRYYKKSRYPNTPRDAEEDIASQGISKQIANIANIANIGTSVGKSDFVANGKSDFVANGKSDFVANGKSEFVANNERKPAARGRKSEICRITNENTVKRMESFEAPVHNICSPTTRQQFSKLLHEDENMADEDLFKPKRNPNSLLGTTCDRFRR